MAACRQIPSPAPFGKPAIPVHQRTKRYNEFNAGTSVAKEGVLNDRLIANLNDEKSTRQKLATALFEMCRQKPFDKITVGDIVSECGVSRKTFYNHFENIDALVAWILQNEAERAKSLFKHGATKEEATQKVIDWFVFYQDNREFLKNIFMNDRDGACQKALYNSILDDLVYQVSHCIGTPGEVPDDLMGQIRFYANGIMYAAIQYVTNDELAKTPVEYTGRVVAEAMSIPLQKAYGWL